MIALTVPIVDAFISNEVARRRVSRGQVLQELTTVYQNLVVDAVRWHDATAAGVTVESTT